MTSVPQNGSPGLPHGLENEEGYAVLYPATLLHVISEQKEGTGNSHHRIFWILWKEGLKALNSQLHHYLNNSDYLFLNGCIQSNIVISSM